MHDLNAEQWARARQLAAVQVDEVRALVEEQERKLGRVPHELTMTVYLSDKDALRCTGEPIDAALHWAAMTTVAKVMREEGIAVRLVPVKPEEYFAWLGGNPNTPAKRAEYGARRPVGPAPSHQLATWPPQKTKGEPSKES